MGSGKARPEKKEKPWTPRETPPTRFGRWYREREFSPARLIELLECSRNYAYDLLSGKRTPRLEHAVAIIDWSKGKLKARDFLPSDPD